MIEFLRNYKIVYKIYNFFNKKSLVHNVPLYKKYGLNKKYYSTISSADFKNIESPKNIFDRKDSKIELPKNKDFNSLDSKIQSKLLNWSDDGFVVLDEFFSSDEIDSFNNEIDHLVETKQANWRYQNKIMFAIRSSKLLFNAGTKPTLLKVLNLLMGKNVDLFQSINFYQGSQQRTHSDSIHMTTFPYGNLIAIWVALEDISAESGPLHYYPGSHKLPYVMNAEYNNEGSKYKLGTRTYGDYEDHIENIVKENGFEKKTLLAKKGDVLIWHANLLHGGEAVIDPKSTRKSMVFHYYAEDSICYHEVSQRPTLKK